MERKRIKLYFTLPHVTKQIVVFVLFGVCSAIILSSLYFKKNVSMTEALQSKFDYFIIFTIVSTIIHVIYLYILFDILIFRHPLEKKIWLIKLLIPVFLVLAYVSYTLKSWAAIYASSDWGEIIGVFSIVCFFILYLLWAINDYKYKNNIWFFLDIISIVLLIIIQSTQGWISSRGKWEQFAFSPNGVVAFSVIAYVGLELYSTIENKGLKYQNYYRNYRDNNQVILPPAIYIDFSSFKDGVKIMDFGCGSGERLKNEYNEWITWKNFPIQKIIGVDKIAEYKNSFTANVKNAFESRISEENIFFKNKVSKKDFRNVDLVIISHVTYYYKVVKQITKYLKSCKTGTYIMIRISSPNSFFVPVSIAGANNIFSFKSNRGHLGIFWLNRIKEKAKLEQVHKYLVKQSYPINDEYKRESLSILLNHLYDGNLAFRIEDYLLSLSENDISAIPNDDLIYILKKS